jgi:CheY-like chemotaxis protein
MAPSHILIVDDDSLSRELVADLLGAGGVPATDGVAR